MVALFTRAWIEIALDEVSFISSLVALFTRAWIEIDVKSGKYMTTAVALFTRAWIEMGVLRLQAFYDSRRPLHEGVD